MKRLATTLSGVVLLATVGLVPATATTVVPPNCAQAGAPGGVIPGIYVDKEWTFSEAPGSTVAHESIHGAPADDLRVTAPYTGVTFTGSAVRFNDYGLLTTAANNFSPGLRPFSVCIAYSIAAHEYNENMLQWDNSWGTWHGHDPGFVKQTGVYVRAQGTVNSIRLDCVPSYFNDIGTGWHTSALVVRPTTTGDAWVSCIHDGRVFVNTKVIGGLGPVNLAGLMCLGAKCPYADPTHLIGPTDSLRGDVSTIKVGLGAQVTVP